MGLTSSAYTLNYLRYGTQMFIISSWEYPGTQGIGCNAINPDDTTNFLAFLEQLRADSVGKNLILTAATSIFPWVGPNGDRLSDVSGFAKQLDWIAIMNYDIWGSWSNSVGPNAPLDDTCASSANQQGSAVSAVAQWSAAGMPASQIVLGVASYGHSFHVSPSNAVSSDGQLNAYPAFDKDQQPIGDKWDDPAGTDECGNAAGPGGNFDFWGLIDNGFLQANGTVAAGIDYRFDTCSQTVSAPVELQLAPPSFLTIYLLLGIRLQRADQRHGLL